MIFIDEKTQDIAMTRGDYEAIVFCAYEEDESMYELSEGDIVQLQIGKKYGVPLKTYKKEKMDSSTTSEDDYTIEIPSGSTKDMKFGDYYYDVSIITSEGYVCTYIGADINNKPIFTILNEVGGEES